MKKRIFAMLLALTMIIGILPMSVFAEASNWNPWDYTVDNIVGEKAVGKTFYASTTFVPGDGELRMMPTLDAGNATYNAMAYVGIEASSNYPDIVEVKTKDDHVDAKIGKWQGGIWDGADCLQLNVTANKAGTAVVTVNFWYTFSQSSDPYTNPNAKWLYGTMNYTVKVVDSESSKPAKPTEEDLQRFRNYVNTTSSSIGAVYMWCETHDHQAWFDYLTDVEGAYTIGEVEPNDGLVSTMPASTYPWICKITLDATAYLDDYNRQMGAQYGTHYLKDGQAETVVVRAYYNPSHETWYFLRSDAPVYIDITHTSNVPDAPTEDDLFNNGGYIVRLHCVAQNGHTNNSKLTVIKGTVSVGTPYKQNDGSYACDVTITDITPYIEKYDKDCKVAVGTHRAADTAPETVVATAVYTDGYWKFPTAVEYDVTCEVEVPEITDDELADALNRATVLVECTTNDAHVLHEYLASVGLPENYELGELVRFNDMPAYEIELTTSAFIDKYSEDEGRHKAGENTPETLTWYVYHRDEGWAATALDDRSKIVDVVDPDAANVHFMVYKSNDLSKAVVDKKYDGGLVAGDTLDLTKIDISDIYTGSEFIVEGGWYNDYLFNLYKDYAAGERDSKPTDMTELEITGKWQNVILVITDMNKVVYFNTAEDLAEYQQNHDADLVLYSTKAPNGSALPTTDAPTPKREGYTFDYWCREGQTVNVEGQTIGGWTNLYAHWTINEYTVTFDSNGGSAVDAQTVEYGQKATKPADPTKEGWRFLGWYDGEEEFDFDTAITENITLTAHWQKLDPTADEIKAALGNVTVKCINPYAEGTTLNCTDCVWPAFVGMTSEGFTYEEDADNEGTYVVTIPVENFVTSYTKRAGAKHDLFSADTMTWLVTWDNENSVWTSQPAEDGVDNVITVTHAPTYWKEVGKIATGKGIKTECVNGNTGVRVFGLTTAFVYPDQIVSVELTAKGTYTATFKLDKYASSMTGSNGTCPEHDREHYVISDETVTWNFIVTEEDGAYTWTAEPVEEGNDDICEVAHDWIVTFDADNGTEPQTQNVRYEGKATKPADPTKEGNWKFVAWYLGEEVYDFDTVVTGDITLTAHWEETVAPYKVEHYCEQTDGTYTLKETETLEGEIGTKVTAVAKTYPHYVEDTENAERVASGVVIKKSEGELTLKLYYKLDNHTVTFDSNGGTAVETATVKHGQKVTKPADPTKEGNWKFVAWYLGENEFDFDTVITDDITLTAHWNKTPSVVEPKAAAYRVEHYCEQTDGTYTLRETETLVGELKSTVTAVAKDYAHYSENTKHSGRIPSGVVVMPEVKDGEVVVLTLKLYYDLDRVTLSYDLNGGIFFKAHQYDDQTVRYGTKLTAEEAPFRSGFKFVGWNDGAKLYQAGDTIVMTADTTLKAVWSYKNNTNPIPPIDPSKPSTKPTETPVKDNSDKEPSGAIEEEEVTYPTKNDAALLDSENHIAYVNGYNDGTVRPEAKITRAEAATMFYRLLNEDVKAEYETDENEFSDVSEADWYCTAVSTLANIGIFGGYPDGSFRPDAYITRAEFAAICARIDGEDADETAEYSDIDGHWAADEISRVAELGWVKGYTDGTFRPNQQITRAEAMAVINRITERNPETKADLLDSMKTWVDNTEDKWYYIDVQEATVAHDYERKDNGREAWTD